MGCSESKEKDSDQPDENEERSCTDVLWLILYILFWFLMVIIAAFSFVYGNPIRIINGYDSFGNTCGTKNNKVMGNISLSGLDTLDKPYLLFYDIRNLRESLKICVKECPKTTLTTVNDIYNYHLSGVDLCKYGFDYEELKKYSDKKLLSAPLGPCPTLPVYEGKPVLNRCVPKLIKEVTESILSNFYDLLNGWDTLDQILGDLYRTWREILGLAVLSLDDTTPVNTAIKMKVDGSAEECPSPTKQDNSTNRVGKVDEFKVCSPNPFKTASTNPFASEHNKISKSILKPSLLSVNSSSSASCNFILRQSGFNPFNKSANDTKSDNSDKKQINGEVLKFVPLIKSDSQLSNPVESTQSNNATNTTSSTPTFVFGQNLQERVMSDANSSEPSPSTSSINSNGNSSGTSDMLFSSAIKSEVKSDVSKETKSLTESAREYEESRANKRKYDEVQTKTGEEEETNILSISCKLFSFDKVTTTWQERGRGTLRLNDFEVDDGQIGSRLVFRTTGSLRVILNTKIWAEMTIDKASDKSIRLTALDSSGEIRVFLIMSSIDDCRQLYCYLQSRLEKEVALQKRKKLATDDSGEK